MLYPFEIRSGPRVLLIRPLDVSLFERMHISVKYTRDGDVIVVLQRE